LHFEKIIGLSEGVEYNIFNEIGIKDWNKSLPDAMANSEKYRNKQELNMHRTSKSSA